MTEPQLDTVRRMAQLARLALSEEELTVLAPQFERILAAFQQLARYSAQAPQGAEPEGVGRERADEPHAPTPRETTLAPAPESLDGFFGVPKTVGGEA